MYRADVAPEGMHRVLACNESRHGLALRGTERGYGCW
jgi:hypothetical protein